MQKKVHVLLLLCMAFFMVCATVEVSAKAAISPSVVAGQDEDMQSGETFLVPDSPFLFFAPDYITPLSSSPGTAPGIPGVKCVDLDILFSRFLCFCRPDVGLSGGERNTSPCVFADKDYYVLALRRIVV